MTVCHSAGSRSITGLRSSPLLAPALLTTMSTRPSSSIVRSASASTAARSATSDTAVTARRPSARTSSATDSMSRHPAAFSSSG